MFDLTTRANAIFGAHSSSMIGHKLYLGDARIELVPNPQIDYRGLKLYEEPEDETQGYRRWTYCVTIPLPVLNAAVAASGLTLDQVLYMTPYGEPSHWAIEEAGGKVYGLRVAENPTFELQHPEMTFHRLHRDEPGAPAWVPAVTEEF